MESNQVNDNFVLRLKSARPFETAFSPSLVRGYVTTVDRAPDCCSIFCHVQRSRDLEKSHGRKGGGELAVHLLRYAALSAMFGLLTYPRGFDINKSMSKGYSTSPSWTGISEHLRPQLSPGTSEDSPREESVMRHHLRFLSRRINGDTELLARAAIPSLVTNTLFMLSI